LSRAGDVAALARHGFRSPDRALAELPDRWEEDGRWTPVLGLLGDVADPDAALRRLAQLGPDVVERVLAAPDAAGPLLELIGFSEYLTELVARTDGLAGELLGDPRRSRDDLRQFRDAELVHIAARDLTAEPSESSFRASAKALSDLADECVGRLLTAAADGCTLAVLAMGKYGGEELNYASDIDVLFVLGDGDLEAAERTARRVMQEMNGPPVLFRVDADLRPEGRDGPLVRSLGAYHEYYSRWAHVWEFQALIKCRFAAGDDGVGRAFGELIEPFVWPERLADDAIEQVRSMKARAEQEVMRRGMGAREVKLAPGGIRDVEFAVQLLQLVHGRHHPELRARSTLEALELLGSRGFVGEEDVRELTDAYVFLRHTEHRLQLEAGRQTHTLPRAQARREHLARGLRFRDSNAGSALQLFEDRWAHTTTVVRTIHERLFYRPLMEAFAAVPSVHPTMEPEEMDERLAALGFDRPPRVRAAMAELTAGATRRARLMRAILPGMLAWTAETPEPDQAMLRMVDLADELDGLPHLLVVLRDEPPVVELVCKALGTGPVLAGLLQRDPGLIGDLQAVTRDVDHRAHAEALVRRARSAGEAVVALRRFKEGEFLRLATRDLAAGENPEVFVQIAAHLSGVADACLEAAVQLARDEQAARTGGPPPGGFAVVGMGRLGGRELSYASDLDVMFVYERDELCPDGTDARLFHSLVAERVVSLLGSTPPTFRVDAEIRPEGRSGPIARSLESYLVYYQRWASLWEFQALTRARHCAGDRSLSTRLIDAMAPRVWRSALSGAEIDEIRKMKARIERERVRAREDPRFQVKLGVGGLADVEFTVQLQQMRHGQAYPSIRTSNTLNALTALEEAGLMDAPDAAWLRDAYLLLNRVRNHMFLLRGLATDALPTRDDDLERLARSLGYGRLSRSRFLERYRRVTRRARRVTDRLFYGDDSASGS
jgi:glutamate-ammonia-ligase adenylyltransferase